ncbi:MAG: efflux RND transporter permease subunit, partial [Deltaproteobacteria bacterium]|nr:efflux RND transporter permease subunit [Deltaproteobacteria bacterium]
MSGKTKYKGPIAWMANNHVAANLVMAIILIGGIFGIIKSKQEVFPEFSLDVISVQVPYPGASPTDVEQGIILALEEAVRGLDGVKKVTSTSVEGMGTASVEILQGEDPETVLADVKNAVDRITSFPEEAERPLVKLLAPKARVISLILSGNEDLSELHKMAEMVRKDLLDHKEITQVEVDGIPPLEISIEISKETLDKYKITLNQVAASIRAASVDLPAGSVKTSAGEVLVRVSDRKINAEEFSDIILRSELGGSKIRLGDIADIKDTFAETDQESFYNEKRAVRVTAYRVGNETPKQVADVVKKYEAQELKHKLPKDIETATWQDDSELLSGRIKLLNTNAFYGGILVIFILAMFLRLRLALWVSLGIPISFMGAFFLMPVMGASINMITLFALIVTLGMVVDDAIVIGENIYHKMQEGLPKIDAAIQGTQEMAVPVVFSILTTMVAFAPMLFVPGVMGKIFYLIPVVVILVLVFSLFEAFFILPSHLANHTGDDFINKKRGPISKIQKIVSDGLDTFINGPYKSALSKILKFRQVAFAVSIVILLVSVGLIAGGFLPFKFFPSLEGDLVMVTATMPFGTPIDDTKKVSDELERAAHAAIKKNGGNKI